MVTMDDPLVVEASGTVTVWTPLPAVVVAMPVPPTVADTPKVFAVGVGEVDAT